MASFEPMINLVPLNGQWRGVSASWLQEEHILDDPFSKDWARDFFYWVWGVDLRLLQ